MRWPSDNGVDLGTIGNVQAIGRYLEAMKTEKAYTDGWRSVVYGCVPEYFTDDFGRGVNAARRALAEGRLRVRGVE